MLDYSIAKLFTATENTLTHRIDVKSSCSPQHPLLLHIYQLSRLDYDNIIDKYLVDELHHR